jgi:hypothetical protein
MSIYVFVEISRFVIDLYNPPVGNIRLTASNLNTEVIANIRDEIRSIIQNLLRPDAWKRRLLRAKRANSLDCQERDDFMVVEAVYLQTLSG